MIASIAPGGTPPSIPAIAARRVLIAVAHPRIAAGLEALLAAEHRYDVRRASSAADVSANADAVIADAAFLNVNGAPVGVATIVLLDPSADRAALEARVPLARAWLTTSARGEELIAALDDALATSRVAPAAVVQPRPSVVPSIVTATPSVVTAPPSVSVVTPRVEAPPAVSAEAVPARARWTLDDIAGIALVLFGVACAMAALAFLWMLVRP